MKITTCLLFLILVVSCEDENHQIIEIHPEAPNLEITNHSNRSVFFYAIEQEAAKQIRLANPCNNFQPNLAADTTIQFPYEEIMGFSDDAEYVWIWWEDCVSESGNEIYALF